MAPARFSPSQAKILDETKYLYDRSGAEHRFIAVWVVVVEGRVCIRSWNDKPTGRRKATTTELVPA